MSGSKPVDPDFKPRHPPVDLEPIERRIVEREAYTERLREAGSGLRETINADTEIMRSLLTEVRNLRSACAILRGLHERAYTRRLEMGVDLGYGEGRTVAVTIHDGKIVSVDEVPRPVAP